VVDHQLKINSGMIYGVERERERERGWGWAVMLVVWCVVLMSVWCID
jgi:hypothetical protein